MASGGGGGSSVQPSGAEMSPGEARNSSSQAWEWKSHKDLISQGKAKGVMEDDALQSSGSMGLKLGKRTYFEESPSPTPPASNKVSSGTTTAATTGGGGGGGGSGGGGGGTTSGGGATTTTTTTTGGGGGTPGKKGRGSSQTAVIPKCQVEGCKADLSGSKDYHRRHKVCETHSKTPKNVVNGQEQRFCQQCSRFHSLSEFDEGKRSCRRRLAGHNERRRKPQPETLAAYNMGTVSSFHHAAYQRLGVGSSILVDGHADALGYGPGGGSWRLGASQPQFLSKQLVENLPAEKLLLLLQNSKRTTGLPTMGTTPGGGASVNNNNTNTSVKQQQDQMKLTLASSSSAAAGGGGGGGGGGVTGGGLNPVSSSSRALSLLSGDNAWSKPPPSSYELPSPGNSTHNTYVLTPPAPSPSSPPDSKKSLHQQHHHHHRVAQGSPHDAIPLSSSKSTGLQHQHQQHQHHQHQHQHQQAPQQQQQQQSYSSPLGSSSWKFSGSY